MYVFLILIYFIEGNNIRMIGALKDVKLLLKHCDVLFDCTPSDRLYSVICGLGSFLGCETHNAVFTLSKNLAKLIIVLNWVCWDLCIEFMLYLELEPRFIGVVASYRTRTLIESHITEVTHRSLLLAFFSRFSSHRWIRSHVLRIRVDSLPILITTLSFMLCNWWIFSIIRVFTTYLISHS